MHLLFVLMNVLTSVAEGMSANFICDYIRSLIQKHNGNK